MPSFGLSRSAGEILEVTLGHGMKLMRDDVWVKVRKGITTIEEIIRVTKVDAAALVE